MRHDLGESLIQRLPFRHPATAADVVRLQILLREALTAVRFHRRGKSAVLNLACGRADETGALAAALVPAEIGYYLGIDLRAETIAEATKRWHLPTGIIEFKCGDASKIGTIKQLPPFDFIFIRHQNYWNDPPAWDVMLENALATLAPGGLLVCTSYFDREHELMKASLKTRGAELWWDVRHAASRMLPDAPGKSVDRHLAVFSNPFERPLTTGGLSSSVGPEP